MTTQAAELAVSRHAAALTALGVTTVAGVAMHLVGSVDPVDEMISDSVATPIGAAMIVLAVAGLLGFAGVLCRQVREMRPPRAGVVFGLLAVWAIGLVTVAAFPTNLPGTELTAGAVIHRYGAVVLVAVPPMIGLLLALRPWVRTVSWVVGGAALALGGWHVPAMLGGGQPLPYAGLAERIVLLALIGLLAVISWDLTERERERTWT